MSDTSETDSNIWSDSCEGILCKVVSAEFARRLERERDEAREAFVIATDQMVIAQGKVREANKERDEAREEVKLLKAILDLIKKDVS
jgi:predicted house-cleaning NTP pyrophosphatase (Maf/HAM1 superfamily)